MTPNVHIYKGIIIIMALMIEGIELRPVLGEWTLAKARAGN